MGTLLRRTCPRLSALADPENVYRPPEKKRAFLNLLPLPKYSQKMPPRKQPTTKSWLQALMQPPKPRWYNELSQASLYSSVLRYTQYQLTDEKLFKAEEYKTPHNTSREKIRLRNQINEARVQPAFSELQPEAGWEQRLDDAAAKVGDRFCEMMHDLKSVRPSALPHPGLALYGEQVVKTHLVEFLTDLFPRLQSKHLDDLLHRKFSLSNSVNAAARCGLARGMGMDREHLLYVKVTKVNLDYVKHQADLERGRDEIRRGATTPNLVASHFGRERHKWLWKKLSLSDDESQLLEERMKLLRRHLCAFVAYATLVQGEQFTKAFILRYFMPDVALQYFSGNPEMRAWLEVNNNWRFLPSSVTGKNQPSIATPQASPADKVPMVVSGTEVQTAIVCGTVSAMLQAENPLKELELIASRDDLLKQVFGGSRPAYRLQFQGHRGESLEKFMRVGVYIADTLVGEGEGVDYELACRNAAQTTLNSYYMSNERRAVPPQADTSGPASGAEVPALTDSAGLDGERAEGGEAEAATPSPTKMKKKKKQAKKPSTPVPASAAGDDGVAGEEAQQQP